MTTTPPESHLVVLTAEEGREILSHAPDLDLRLRRLLGTPGALQSGEAVGQLGGSLQLVAQVTDSRTLDVGKIWTAKEGDVELVPGTCVLVTIRPLTPGT